MTKLMLIDGIWVDDFGELDGSHLSWMRFAAFAKAVIDRLRATPLGIAFLGEISKAARHLNGGPRYGHASLVIRYPNASKVGGMKAPGETNDLVYSYPTVDFKGLTRNPKGVTRIFRNEIGPGVARPAQIWIFSPNSKLPANQNNTVIESNGRFRLKDGSEEYLQHVLMHEMIHAFHFIIGSLEPEFFVPEVDSDELRAVGLGYFRGYTYSENALRSAVGSPLRTSYHGKGVDNYLLNQPTYFRDRKHSLEPTEVKGFSRDSLKKLLVEWNKAHGLPPC